MSIEPILLDLRQVLRGLRPRPAYVAAAVATLVLVLAANATLFAAIPASRVLRLDPLEVQRP